VPEVLQKFLEVKNIREDTQRNYRCLISGHLEDWLQMPITSITKDMVEQRHRQLTDTPTRSGTRYLRRSTPFMSTGLLDLDDGVLR